MTLKTSQPATQKDLEEVKKELKADIKDLREEMATKQDIQKSRDFMQALFTQFKSEFIEYIDPILKGSCSLS